MNLDELARVTDEIIATLDPKSIGGAVNWADLGCVEARHIRNNHGEEYLEVVIEEASPDASALISAISEGLQARGLKDIAVSTAW